MSTDTSFVEIFFEIVANEESKFLAISETVTGPSDSKFKINRRFRSESAKNIWSKPNLLSMIGKYSSD